MPRISENKGSFLAFVPVIYVGTFHLDFSLAAAGEALPVSFRVCLFQAPIISGCGDQFTGIPDTQLVHTAYPFVPFFPILLFASIHK